MIFKLVYDDNAKLQMELLRIGGVPFTHDFHWEAHENWIGDFEDIKYVTIKTGEDYDS